MMKDLIMEFEDRNRGELYVGFAEVNEALYKDFISHMEMPDDDESKELFAKHNSSVFYEYVEEEYHNLGNY